MGRPGCDTLICYQQEVDADAAIDSMRRNPHVHPSRLARLHKFPCPRHGGWHIGFAWTAARWRKIAKAHKSS